MTAEHKKFAVENEDDAAAAEDAAARYRQAVKDKKFGPLRDIVNDEAFGAIIVDLQRIVDDDTFSDDATTQLHLRNTAMLMNNLKTVAT